MIGERGGRERRVVVVRHAIVEISKTVAIMREDSGALSLRVSQLIKQYSSVTRHPQQVDGVCGIDVMDESAQAMHKWDVGGGPRMVCEEISSEHGVSEDEDGAYSSATANVDSYF